MKKTGAFCAPVPALPPAHFTVFQFRVRYQRHPCAPLYMLKEDHHPRPTILRGLPATRALSKNSTWDSQSQTMRLRSLELGEFEIGTRVAITLYHSLIGLASVQQMFGRMCVLGAGFSREHSDVFVMGLEFARVREQHNCSLNVLLEVGA